MGKRKRSKDDKYENILKKIKKLEEKVQKRRRISSSSSSSEVVVDFLGGPDLTPTPSDHEIDHEITEVLDSQNVTEANVEDDPELNPEILEILGNDPTTEKIFGQNLHKDIATRWKHILLNGLAKEMKSDLLKSYLPAENCPNMQGPTLNLEIKAALTEMAYKKDFFSHNKQKQLSSCLSAVGKALNVALMHSEPAVREIIKPLSDAGRLLCDFHYWESQSRRYSIINILNKETRDIVKNTKIDEFLFGSELADHLKSSKAISKSGSELKQVYKPRQVSPQATTPRRGALNARGAPRTPAAAKPRARQAAAPRSQPPPPPLPPLPPGRRTRDSTTYRSNNYHRNLRTRR